MGDSQSSSPSNRTAHDGVREKGRQPWKEDGYPALCAWMASSNDFFLVRRFTRTSARVLLYLQDQVAQKERYLDELDEWTKGLPEGQGGCGSFLRDVGSPREEAIKELARLLKDYLELFEAMSAVKTRPTAQDHQVCNLGNWFSNNAGAIDESETDFANHRGDLVPLVSKPKPAFRLLTQKLPSLHRIFKVGPREDRVISDTTFYHNEKLLDAFTNFIIVSCGLVMIFAPLWWLNFVVESTTRLAVTTGFVTLFTILLVSATVASPFETLAATAAYAALLMVYIGGSATPSSSIAVA